MWRRVYLSPVPLLEEKNHKLRYHSDIACQVMAYQIGRRGQGGRSPIENDEVMILI